MFGIPPRWGATSTMNYRTNLSVKLFAVVFAFVMAMSMVAMGAAVPAPGAGEQVDDQQVDDLLQPDQVDSTDVDIDVDLNEISDDEEVDSTQIMVRFDPADIPDDVQFDREAAVDYLQSHADETQRDAADYIRNTEGVEIVNHMWLTNAMVVEVADPDFEVDRLAEQNHVTQIHDNHEVELEEPQSDSASPQDEVTYGLDMHNVTDVHEMGITGDGAVIANLDTGIEPDHPDWEDRVDNETYEIWDDDGNPIGEEPSDTSGHGTHVAGTAAGVEDPDGDVPQYGVAPDAEVWHGNVIPGGFGTAASVIAGMEWAVEEAEADAMGLSLGLDGDDGWGIEATENAVDAGTLVSASNGNNNPSTPGYYYSSFGSQAINENQDPASFAIWDEVDTEEWYGDDAPDHWPDTYISPDLSAAGVAVLSSYQGDYDELSGTSMSQPHKLGTAALMTQAAGDMDVEFFQEVLEDTSVDIGDDPIFGEGMLDSEAAVEAVAFDQEIEGTVYDAAGDGLADADVEVEETEIGTSTDEDGHYELLHEAGEWDVTADGFGHAPATETVELEENETAHQDFELDAELDLELLEDQASLVQTGDDIDVKVKPAHADYVTIEEIAGYEGDLTLYVDGEEAEFGEQLELDLDGWYDEVEITVETGDEEGDVELEHTFEGAGDELTATTGPTEVTDLDGMVYAGSDDNSLYAYEAATGDEQWSHDMGNDVRASPIVTGGYVFAATFDGNLEKLDAASGDVEWTNNDADSIFSDPVASEEHGMVWVGTNDARLLAVDMETGETEWEIDADDNVGAATNVVDDTLYVGDNAGNFWAIDAMTGDILWEDDSGDDYVGAATWTDGEVVTADRGASEVRVYDADDGEIIWENDAPTGDLWSPTVSPEEGMVYAGDEGALHAFDLEDGDLEFSIDTNDRIVASPTVHDGSVIFADDAEAGTIWSADAETGDVEWEFDADEGVAGSPTVADGVVYVGAGVDRLFGPDDGYLYALDAASGDEIWTVENMGDGHGFFGNPTFVEDGESTGSAALLGTDQHNDLFPVPDLDQGAEGQVTDMDGEPIEGASVSALDEPFSTITDEDGYYELPLEPGEYEIEADAFGFSPATEMVEVEEDEFVEQDFELEGDLEVELIQDQPDVISSEDDIEVLVEVSNLEALTVEQSGDLDEDYLTLYVAGEEAEFGEPVELGGFSGEADVVVEMEDGVEGTVELDHTFEGAGNEIEVTTGPTEVLPQLLTVGVIEDGGEYADEWVEKLEDLLGDAYHVEHVDSEDALDELDMYDAFFVHELTSADEDDWFDATDDVGTVYTSQNLGPETLDQRSDTIDDPTDVTQGTDLATWTVEEEHDLFDGVAEPGDDITVHTDSFEDGASFTGTDADVIASQADGDHGVAVDDEREDVLLTAVGFGWIAPGEHTDDALDVLGNSVEEFAAPDPVADSAMMLEDVNVSNEFPADNMTLSAEDEETAGFLTEIHFDPDHVEIEDVEAAGPFSDVQYNVDHDEGELRIAGAAETGYEDPDLADIHVNASGMFDASDFEFGDVTTLELQDISELVDEMGERTQDLDLEDGDITALEDELGDVLGDGEIHPGDAVTVQRFLADLDIPVDEERVEVFGDVTQTGEVTSADVTALLQEIAEDGDGFEPEEEFTTESMSPAQPIAATG